MKLHFLLNILNIDIKQNKSAVIYIYIVYLFNFNGLSSFNKMTFPINPICNKVIFSSKCLWDSCCQRQLWEQLTDNFWYLLQSSIQMIPFRVFNYQVFRHRCPHLDGDNYGMTKAVFFIRSKRNTHLSSHMYLTSDTQPKLCRYSSTRSDMQWCRIANRILIMGLILPQVL